MFGYISPLISSLTIYVQVTQQHIFCWYYGCGLLVKQLSIIFTYKNVYRVALEVEKQWFNVLDSISFN